jgi:hypothetical protein
LKSASLTAPATPDKKFDANTSAVVLKQPIHTELAIIIRDVARYTGRRPKLMESGMNITHATVRDPYAVAYP